VRKLGVRILRLIVVTAVGLSLFRGLQPIAELCAVSICRRWPTLGPLASFSGYVDFLALALSVITAVLVVQHLSKRYLNPN